MIILIVILLYGFRLLGSWGLFGLWGMGFVRRRPRLGGAEAGEVVVAAAAAAVDSVVLAAAAADLAAVVPAEAGR